MRRIRWLATAFCLLLLLSTRTASGSGFPSYANLSGEQTGIGAKYAGLFTQIGVHTNMPLATTTATNPTDGSAMSSAFTSAGYTPVAMWNIVTNGSALSDGTYIVSLYFNASTLAAAGLTPSDLVVVHRTNSSLFDWYGSGYNKPLLVGSNYLSFVTSGFSDYGVGAPGGIPEPSTLGLLGLGAAAAAAAARRRHARARQ